MAFDIKKLLEKVPADKRAALESSLKESDELIKELEAGYLRQDDYSRKSDDLATQKKEFETEKTVMEENWLKANEAYKELLNDYNSTADDRKTARDKLAKAEKDLEELKAKQVQIDPAKHITIDQHKEEMSRFAGGQAAFMMDVFNTVSKLETLTKKRVNPADIINGALEKKQSPTQFAEEKFGIKKLEEDAAKAEQTAHDEEIRKQEREKVTAELTNPNLRPLEDSKQPFYTPEKDKDGKAVNPWEIKETPADEAALLNELTAARR